MTRVLAPLIAVLLLIGCVAKPAQQTVPDNPFDRPPPASSLPVGPLNPDVSCKTDADCVVKDVGNCCGTYPQCVNKQATVDPKAVQAACAKQGMAGVCGFPVIAGCTCVRGQCSADERAQR